ncbi:MAG: hypothetical protein LBT54_03510 [Bifidobacteriaceae bacterium]|nr:hypothetical protein [Bifidobacteriaceae bacterium]
MIRGGVGSAGGLVEQDLFAQSGVAEAPGLDGPAGFVARGGEEFAVVGTFDAPEPFEEFDSGILVPAGPDARPATRLAVEVTGYEQAGRVEDQVLRIIAGDRGDLQVISPVSLAEIQAEVSSGFASYARQLFALILALGVGVIAVVVLVDILLLRSDLGRRRAPAPPAPWWPRWWCCAP